MTKKLLENGKQFHINQKETYTFEDVKSIIGQHKDFIISETNDKINEKLTSLEGDLTKAISEKEDFAKSKEEQEKALEALTSKYENLEGELKPFKQKESKLKSKELLKGLVVEGSEYDVFTQLDLEGIEFTDEDTTETKQEKIKSQIDSILENKPYLKPSVETPPSDDPELVATATGKEIKEKEFTGANALRKN